MKIPFKPNKKDPSYFNAAQTWADERYAQNERSRARYQAGFLLSMGLNVAASLALVALAQVHTLVPLLVHHYEHGVTTIEPVKTIPLNEDQMKSDIVRYVQHRESYDAGSYRYQFDLVRLLSSSSVAREYVLQQRAKNADSPITALNDKFSRSVHVYSVNLLDSVMENNNVRKGHHNLAEVVFSLKDTEKATGTSVVRHYNTVIAWQYVTPPESPEERWQNFNGFQVTSYQKQSRNQ